MGGKGGRHLAQPQQLYQQEPLRGPPPQVRAELRPEEERKVRRQQRAQYLALGAPMPQSARPPPGAAGHIPAVGEAEEETDGKR